MSVQLMRSVAALPVLFCVVTTACAADDVSASAVVPGCQVMLLLDVVDGDTVHGYIDTSDPEVVVHASLRLSGIDTPEVGGRAKCVEERSKGDAARKFLRTILSQALDKPTRKVVRACDIGEDKYAKRRLGRLEVKQNGRWIDVNRLLLENGLAFSYHGGRRGKTWCTCLQSGVCPAGYNG